MPSAPERITPRARAFRPSRNCASSRLTNFPTGRGSAWPIIDGWVIPDDQYKLYAAGKYNDTPILVGYNSDEGASFSPPRTPEDYITSVKSRYGKFADDLIKAYPRRHKLRSENRARPDPGRGVRLAHVDLGAASGADRKIQGLLLLFRPAPGLSGGFAARRLRHRRTARMWPTFSSISIPTVRRPTKADLEISEAMSTYWVNFAKRGDPERRRSSRLAGIQREQSVK